MNSIAFLFIIVLTPKPECIEAATKANLTNCRPSPLTNGYYLYGSNGGLVMGSGADGAGMICDLVPEKDRKPIPERKFEITIEEPFSKSVDPCYDREVGTLEPKKYSDSFAWAISASSITSFTGVITFRDDEPKKKKKKTK